MTASHRKEDAVTPLPDGCSGAVDQTSGQTATSVKRMVRA